MHFGLLCAVGLTAMCAVDATYSLDDATLAVAALDGALSHPVYSSTIIQDGFRSQFLYNGSKVLFGNVESLLYAQIRTLQKFGKYYHLWAGFEDGAFIGYFDKGGTVAGSDESFYTIAWQSSYNHSCDYNTTKTSWEAKLNVPASGLSYPGWPSSRETDMRLSSYCREYFHAKKDNGNLVNSFSAQAYDCRMRGWYFSVKRNRVTQWTGIYVDRTTNEVAIPLCVPLLNATGYTTDDPDRQFDSKVLPDDNMMLGVACTGFYLSDISRVLLSIFADFETNAVYIRERGKGYLIAASTASSDGYYDNTKKARVYAADSSDPLLKWSAKQLTKYGNGSWPINDVIIVRDANETILPSRRYRNLSSVVAGRSYYIASQPFTSNGLEWDIVTMQLLSCPLNSERGCKHDGPCKDSELVCSECIYPHTSLGGNAYCDVCAKGYYMDVNGDCKQCPSTWVHESSKSTISDICPKGSTYRTIQIEKYYFRYPESSMVYACPIERHCTGNISQPCQRGTTGPQCTVCTEGYWQTGTGECQKCKKDFLAIAGGSAGGSAAVLLAFVILIMIFVNYQKIVPESCVNQISYSLGAKNALFHRILKPEFWSRFKILWTAYQIMSATKQTMPSLKFPMLFELLRSILDSICNFNVINTMPVACIIEGEYNIYGALVFKTLNPIVLWCIVSLVLKSYHNLRPKDAPRTFRTTYVLLLIAFVALPSVSETVFSVWHCTEFKRNDDPLSERNTIRRLSVDHSISCQDNGVLTWWRIYSCVLMFSPWGGPIGTPLYVFWHLWGHRDQIQNPPGDTAVEKLVNRGKDMKLGSYSFIFASYSCDFWWYETFEISRRVLLTGFLVLIPEIEGTISDGTLSLRYFTAVLLSFCSIIIHESTRPYQDFSTNTLALFCHIAIFSIFLVALQIHLKVIQNRFEIALVLAFVLLSPLSFFMYFQYYEEERRKKKILQENEETVQKEELRTQLRHLLADSNKLACKANPDAKVHNSQRLRALAVFAHGSPARQLRESFDAASMNHAEKVMKDLRAMKNAMPKFDEKGSYPCYVMSLDNILGLDRLITHEEALHADPPLVRVVSRESTYPSPAHCYFISQNWESPDHPDNNRLTKLKMLQNLRSHVGIDGDREVWIWFDIFSIPQANRKMQLLAIDSIQYYSALISRFIPLVRDADTWREEYQEEPSKTFDGAPRGTLETYQSRGWCRLEVFSALCPKRYRDGSWRPGPVGLRYFYHHTPSISDGKAMGPILDAHSLLHPLAEDIEYTCCAKAREAGIEEHECDRPKIKKIIGDIAATYIAYAASGSTEWDMTLDMSKLPGWIYEEAQSAAFDGKGSSALCNIYSTETTIIPKSSVELPEGWISKPSESKIMPIESPEPGPEPEPQQPDPPTTPALPSPANTAFASPSTNSATRRGSIRAYHDGHTVHRGADA